MTAVPPAAAATSRRAASRARLCAALLAAACLWPTEAAAQLRYVVHGDVREQFNSNVFAGMEGSGQWDMVTELEPGFRLYLARETSLLWLRYRLLFQLFARTDDPNAGHKLLGYANDLSAEYSRLLSARTGWRVANRFGQGTENTTLPGVASGAGLPQSFLTTGSKFITDALTAELQHLFSERWSYRPRLSVQYFHVYDALDAPTVLPPPESLTIGASSRVDFMLENDTLYLETDITALREDRSSSNPALSYPHALYTFLLSNEIGWRHTFNESWDTRLTAGVDLRVLEGYGILPNGNPDPNTTFDTSFGPVGGASLRYRRGRSLAVELDYSHRYQVLAELGVGTIANLDQVSLLGHYILDDWHFQAGGSFRYIRTSARQTGLPSDEGATKVGLANAAVGYLLRAGLSLELLYDFEIVRDRFVPGLPAATVQPSTDYTRHRITLGLSFAWPPPPPQDVRINRRESDYEPIFATTGGGARQQGGEGMLDPRAARQRALDETRQREAREQQLERERRETRGAAPDQEEANTTDSFDTPTPP
jgi:hypothetical protein